MSFEIQSVQFSRECNIVTRRNKQKENCPRTDQTDNNISGLYIGRVPKQLYEIKVPRV